MDFSPHTLALIAAIFLLAGGVKGLIGVGLPTVALAVLINVVPLRDAIMLIVVPSVVTNAWQALGGGHGAALVKRFWPFLATLCFGTWLGVGILAKSDQTLLSAILGGILALYAIINLLQPVPPPPGRHEPWISPVLGLVNGLISGATGSYAFPSVVYLEALRLGRDELIQGMGLIFLTASCALGLSLTGRGVMNLEHAGMSAIALAPSLIGYYLGEHYRRRLPQQLFRRIFLIGLLFLGGYTVVNHLFF